MTPTKITPALHAYLTDWLAWVDRGAPDGEPYSRETGLCTNAGVFLLDLHTEMEGIFEDDGYPFGGTIEYIRGCRQATQHLNEARLAWVRSTLATAEIEA